MRLHVGQGIFPLPPHEQRAVAPPSRTAPVPLQTRQLRRPGVAAQSGQPPDAAMSSTTTCVAAAKPFGSGGVPRGR